jgi:hypothetical protein
MSLRAFCSWSFCFPPHSSSSLGYLSQPLFIFIQCPPTTVPSPLQKVKFKFSQLDFAHLHLLLSAIDWSPILSCSGSHPFSSVVYKDHEMTVHRISLQPPSCRGPGVGSVFSSLLNVFHTLCFHSYIHPLALTLEFGD